MMPAIGDRVTFVRPDGAICDDIVRDIGETHQLLMPYAPNRTLICVVLTNHSWCLPKDIIDIKRSI